MNKPMKFSFTLPSWLNWLVPQRLKDDHDRRGAITGKASTSFLGGFITVISCDDDR